MVNLNLFSLTEFQLLGENHSIQLDQDFYNKVATENTNWQRLKEVSTYDYIKKLFIHFIHSIAVSNYVLLKEYLQTLYAMSPSLKNLFSIIDRKLSVIKKSLSSNYMAEINKTR